MSIECNWNYVRVAKKCELCAADMELTRAQGVVMQFHQHSTDGTYLWGADLCNPCGIHLMEIAKTQIARVKLLLDVTRPIPKPLPTLETETDSVTDSMLPKEEQPA